MKDPMKHWEKILFEEEVPVPNSDGTGVVGIKVKVPAYRDPSSGEIYFSGEGMRLLDDAKARHMGLISRDELKRLRERIGLTQAQLCELLQLGAKTWSRWETGRERPSRSMNLLLLAFKENRIDVRWLRSKLSSKRLEVIGSEMGAYPELLSDSPLSIVAEPSTDYGDAAQPARSRGAGPRKKGRRSRTKT